MNNLLSYCGLVDVTINVYGKDLPVRQQGMKIKMLTTSCPIFTINPSKFLKFLTFCIALQKKCNPIVLDGQEQ